MFKNELSNADKLLEYIERYNISGEEVFRMFIDWHGEQLCTNEFIENLRECEGYEV